MSTSQWWLLNQGSQLPQQSAEGSSPIAKGIIYLSKHYILYNKAIFRLGGLIKIKFS
jgi:hypothetical protein